MYLFFLLAHSRFWHLKYKHSVFDLACLTSSSPAVQRQTQLFSPNGLPNDSWMLNVALVVSVRNICFLMRGRDE